jgi:hypothetical protein
MRSTGRLEHWAGYLLGRSHKMRWAMLLAAAGATGRLPGTTGELLERGTKALGSSPEVSELIETARKRLLEPGKAAIMANLSSQIDSLSQRLEQQGESQRPPSRPSGTAEEEEEAEQPSSSGQPQEEPEAEEGYEEEDYGEGGVRAAAATGRGAAGGAGAQGRAFCAQARPAAGHTTPSTARGRGAGRRAAGGAPAAAAAAWCPGRRRYLSETSMALLLATDHPDPSDTTGNHQEVAQLTTP